MTHILNDLLINSGQAVSFMLQEITHICRDIEKRAPGSKGERKAAEYLAGMLEKDCGCRSVIRESFKVHPDSFYGYFYFSAVLDTLCTLCFFISPWLSLVFGCLALLLFIFHFVLYKEILDPVFPEKESVNITAVRPCSGEVKQRIFLNGHVDAAWEFPLNYYFGGVVFEIPGVMATIGVLFYIALSICRLLDAGAWAGTAGKWGMIFVPFYILLAITFNPGRIVDGANDNLSGCFMGTSLLYEMEKSGVMLKHTEIGVILTGSEEAGIRGAKAWAKVHSGEYRDVPTYIICFDTIHDPDHLMINERDLNSTVKSDKKLCSMFLDAAAEAGVKCKTGKVPLFGGSTDSAAFTQGGFRSIGITGLNHVLEDYYHTRRDSFDNMNPEGLENCYKALIMLIDDMENAALRDEQ